MKAGARPPAGEITRLLHAWNRGDTAARDALVPLVYAELRRCAASHLRREGRSPTLRPTELVHEAYLRLAAQTSGFQNRDQFFALAARLMRRILTDRARARHALKRGRAITVTLEDDAAAEAPRDVDLVALDRALSELALLDPRQESLVELRFFGGLTLDEAGRALGVSLTTANRDWATARAWLFRRLTSQVADGR